MAGMCLLPILSTTISSHPYLSALPMAKPRSYHAILRMPKYIPYIQIEHTHSSHLAPCTYITTPYGTKGRGVRVNLGVAVGGQRGGYVRQVTAITLSLFSAGVRFFSY